jgi:Ca2+/Na+ antiporter
MESAHLEGCYAWTAGCLMRTSWGKKITPDNSKQGHTLAELISGPSGDAERYLMNENRERAGRPWQIPPLVARELLVYSRQPWTYWLRLLSALGAVSVLAIMATTGQHRFGKADGLSLFAGSTVILFFIASLNGLRSTSNCIGSERRQGTLVLLFLANLKLRTILISKLVTNSMRNVWAFLGTLPVLGLCLLLGGVSGWVFVQGVLAVLAAAWLSLMVGLEQSCRNQGEHEAFSLGLRRLLLLNLVPFVSPASLVLSAFLARDFAWKAYFWATLGGTVWAGFYHWWLAKSALASNWQESPPEEGPVHSGPPAPAAPPVTGHLQKPPRLCGNMPPAYWLFARYGDTRQVGPLPIGICFVATAGFVVLVSDPDTIMLAYPLLMGAGRLVQMLAMAKIAPQSFADIARPGALEILQTTPITLKQIVRAAYNFLFVHFRRGVLPMLGLDALVLLMVVLRTTKQDSAWGFARGLLAQDGLFLSGLCAMGVTGIWLGLKQRSLARASFSACFYFLLLPASLYVLRSMSTARTTVVLVIAYCAVAVVMHRKLGRLVQGGDSVQPLLRRPEW